MTVLCVCTHEPVDHTDGGWCTHDCGCSYVQLEGTEGGPTWATHTTYRGVYSNRDWREPA